MIYEDPWHSVYFSCHLWSFEPVDGSLAEALSLCIPSTRSNFRTASITSSLVFELTPDRQTHSSKVTKILKQFQTWSNFKPFRWFGYCCQVAGHHFVGDVDLTTCRSLPHLPCLPPGSMRCNLWWQFSPQDKHWWSKQNWRPVLFNLFPWKGLRSGHLCNERPNTHTPYCHTNHASQWMSFGPSPTKLAQSQKSGAALVSRTNCWCSNFSWPCWFAGHKQRVQKHHH